ncbi:MAG: 50S ribosomal protein L10 [Synechococcaceae cyanobacterium SM2_3_2]|nr:50S ribosomal protein L10 [Synechococcaceae cyanobacterium SM2_3_2]
MGKQTLARKAEIIEDVQSLLDASQMVLIIDYKGLTVFELNDFRAELRESDSVCMVVKNTLMRRAIADRPTWVGVSEYLAGPSAFVMIRGDIPKAVKTYQDFQKKSKKTEVRGAAIDGLALTLDQAKAIADLPPKEILMAQAAGAIKAVATKLAVGINAVPTQLVTGINEVPASLARALQAIASKQDEAA